MRDGRCWVILVWSLSLAACGESDELTCETSGSAIVNGTVGDVEVSPVMRAQQITRPGLGVVVVLDEASGACGEVSTTGEHVVLAFCDTPSARTYPVVRDGFTCPSDNAFVLIERNGGSDYAGGISGAVNISSTTDGCVSGSFDVTMRLIDAPMTEHPVSGSFAAIVCP